LENTERWLGIEEIAEHIGVAPVTIYRWLEKQKIPAHRVGKLWKFKASEVDQWIQGGGAEDAANKSNRKNS
jgi:excisionase family DNA binding protein